MNEKKVREAIYCMKASIGETMCEECVNYYGCDHTKMDDMMRTAIDCCNHCGQRLDWSE